MKVGKLGWLVAMFLSGGMAVAQGTADDYRRAYALKEKFSADKVFYSNVNPQWIEGTHQFWYVRNTPDGRLYVSVDADKKARKELFDSHRLAKALGAASGKEVKPEALALGHLSVSKGLDTLRFVFNNQRWMYASRKNQLVNEGAVPLLIRQKHWMEVDDEKTASPVPSPDGKWIAFIKNQNIYVKEVATGKEKQLSLDGTLGNYYSAYIRWSPDSKKVASCKSVRWKSAMFIMWNLLRLTSFSPSFTNRSMRSRETNFLLKCPASMKWKADEALFLLPNCSTGNMKYMVPNGIPTAVP